ncbi:MAG: hypothetical protein J6D15_05685 [Clostridia bacterium]|nr:hypothetical protein [Clostridia bacterium]
METKHPDILKILKFGKQESEKIFFCEVCGETFDEFDDYRMTDRFGRCFCGLKCRAEYYSRD